MAMDAATRSQAPPTADLMAGLSMVARFPAGRQYMRSPLRWTAPPGRRT